MAATLNAGLALDWVRTLFTADWEEFYGSIERVPPGSEGVTFLPYLVPERAPRLDGEVGASWSGIALSNGRDHLMKASLEGVAFALREAMESLEATGVTIADLHLSGGGAANQLADVLGKRLVAAGSTAGAARGAALLAGLGAGVYKSPDEIAKFAPRYELVAAPGPSAQRGRAAHRRPFH
jgi:xylulokinase